MKLPHIGYRNLKTAISASLCALLYAPFGRNPVFACIGAIIGMGNDIKHSFTQGANRLMGTIIGGVIGIILYTIYLWIYPSRGHYLLLVLLLYIGIIALIEFSQRRWPGAIQAGGVVLCIVLFTTTEESYITYALDRMLDTGIGVVMSLVINVLLTRERLDWVKYKFLGLFGIKREDGGES